VSPVAIIAAVYLADGEPYLSTYASVRSQVRALAVGWLDPSHPYPVGNVDDEFLGHLFEACRTHAVARTRGWYRCPFCRSEAGVEPPAPTTVARGGEFLPVGDAEIRVVTKDGTWLVAPTLVLHYVLEHAYRPPPEFVEAVTSSRFAPH
jgi:hypothetical protein